ncbi:unnamed protein product [Linum tenue]|uniref:Polygalacturonase n=1 Tax=Linum tenue TaxID=586396 RepID=A0AAV0ISW7_9ROSI|nr:unnamed protein product [Linum tenue]
MSTLYVKNMTLTKLHMIAPADSRNTDGIHISRSSCITVTDSSIATGDDCKYITETPLKSITIQNCTIADSDNGIRIKSWPDMFATSLTDVHFEDIILENVDNPIIIDQMYCPDGACKSKGPSKVQISDVFFKNVKGTSKCKEIIQLICSSSHPCQNVQMCDVDITYEGGVGQAVCENVKPVISGVMNPKGC